MSSLVIVGLLATFAAVLTAAMAIGGHAADRRRSVHLLEASVGAAGGGAPDLREQALAPSFLARSLGSISSTFSPLLRRLAPAEAREQLASKIVRAGSPAGWDAEKIIVIRLVAAVGLPLIVFLALPGLGGIASLIALAGAAYAGYFGPTIILDGKVAKRKTAIRRALPDTIDLLTISVEAGLGFDAALRQVVDNVPGELSEEFVRTLREMQLGTSRADAFRNFRERTDLEELRGLTMAIIQADAFGISIGNVLRAQSQTLRLKRKQQTEEQAMKVPVKILFPVIFCVLPSLFVVVLGPGVIRLINDFFG